jgi:hypothetical protein
VTTQISEAQFSGLPNFHFLCTRVYQKTNEKEGKCFILLCKSIAVYCAFFIFVFEITHNRHSLWVVFKKKTFLPLSLQALEPLTWKVASFCVRLKNSHWWNRLVTWHSTIHIGHNAVLSRVVTSSHRIPGVGHHAFQIDFKFVYDDITFQSVMITVLGCRI